MIGDGWNPAIWFVVIESWLVVLERSLRFDSGGSKRTIVTHHFEIFDGHSR